MCCAASPPHDASRTMQSQARPIRSPSRPSALPCRSALAGKRHRLRTSPPKNTMRCRSSRPKGSPAMSCVLQQRQRGQADGRGRGGEEQAAAAAACEGAARRPLTSPAALAQPRHSQPTHLGAMSGWPATTSGDWRSCWAEQVTAAAAARRCGRGAADTRREPLAAWALLLLQGRMQAVGASAEAIAAVCEQAGRCRRVWASKLGWGDTQNRRGAGPSHTGSSSTSAGHAAAQPPLLLRALPLPLQSPIAPTPNTSLTHPQPLSTSAPNPQLSPRPFVPFQQPLRPPLRSVQYGTALRGGTVQAGPGPERPAGQRHRRRQGGAPRGLIKSRWDRGSAPACADRRRLPPAAGGGVFGCFATPPAPPLLAAGAAQ